jgi:hypothetical protein
MHYLTWNLSTERQRHEWMRLRRVIVSVRMSLLIGGHAAYFGVCAVGHGFGTLESYGQSLFVGVWSLLLIGLLLLALEHIYAHNCPSTPPRYVIRNTGITRYGEDGPEAHFTWSSMRWVSVESDPRRREFRSLVLTGEPRLPWLRHAGRVVIPLPDAEAETAVVRALGMALLDNGMNWTARGDAVRVEVAACAVSRQTC